ncbi:MAG: SDR family NAD(P)-dependent oxidoreductase, partial [Spirochaetes bacterium]|nr:SDR family NAD(P)-dependent oxidoreductase [Spirochaetota bacterium]
LGIDSIKQVEIMSSLQEKLPDSPIVKPEDMGKINTLRDLNEFLASREKVGEVIPLSKKKRLIPSDSLSRSVLRAVKLDEAARGKKISVEGGTKFLITDTFPKLANDIRDRLISLGYGAEIVPLKNQETINLPESLGGLIILSPEKEIVDNFIIDSFRLLRLCAPLLRKTGQKTIFTTVSVMDGLFGLGEGVKYNPISGGLAGLAKTAGHEFPEVNCKAIDIPTAAKNTASKIVEEIFYDGAVEVGINNNGLYTLKTVEEKLGNEGKNLAINAADTIFVTGGARGVTAEVAVAVAGRFGTTMVLVGRSAPPKEEPDWLACLDDERAIKRGIISHADKKISPKEIEQEYRGILSNREVRRNIERINMAGGQAFYYSADIRDRKAMVKLLADIKENHGEIRGLIHGAGVLADKKIENKRDDEFEMVFSTKVFPLLNILETIDREALKSIVLFSSITGRVGRRGQIDYAAANEVLNKVAQQQSRLLPNCRVVSVNWGPWDGGMVNDALKKIFTKEGIGLIPLKEGAEYLVEEISSDRRDVEILILGRSGEPEDGSGEFVGEASSPFKKQLSLTLNSRNYPILKSHVIKGNQVAPMAMIIEWMSHAALHANPGLKFTGLRNLRILKGMIIRGNDSIKADIFSGKIRREGENYIVPMEIRGEGRKVLPTIYSSGEIVISETLPEPVTPS